MTDLPTGDLSPDDLKVPVRVLAAAVGVSVSLVHRLGRQGRAPKSDRGIPLNEAIEWLRARRAKKAAREEAIRRLRSLLSSDAAASAEEGEK